MTVYKINDLVKFNFLKIPKTLFANPKYREMSSDAKLAYALLCDRLSLSKQNNWINSDGEVYLIYTRKAIAEDLG
ncbi:MAG: replication initiator protein A, partial [Hominilimicola sp.]